MSVKVWTDQTHVKPGSSVKLYWECALGEGQTLWINNGNAKEWNAGVDAGTHSGAPWQISVGPGETQQFFATLKDSSWKILGRSGTVTVHVEAPAPLSIKVWTEPSHARPGDHVKLYWQCEGLNEPGRTLWLNNGGSKEWSAGVDAGTESGDPWQITAASGTQTFFATLKNKDWAILGSSNRAVVKIDDAPATPIKLWTVPKVASKGDKVKLFYECDPIGKIFISNGDKEFSGADNPSGGKWEIFRDAGTEQKFTLMIRDIDGNELARSEAVGVQVLAISTLRVSSTHARKGDKVILTWDDYEGPNKVFINNSNPEGKEWLADDYPSGGEWEIFQEPGTRQAFFITVKEGAPSWKVISTSPKVYVDVDPEIRNFRVSQNHEKKGKKVTLSWDYDGDKELYINNSNAEGKEWSAGDYPSGGEWEIFQEPGTQQAFFLTLKEGAPSWKVLWTSPKLLVSVDAPLSLSGPAHAKREDKIGLVWDGLVPDGCSLWMNNGGTEEFRCQRPMESDGDGWVSGRPDWTVSGETGSTMTFFISLKDERNGWKVVAQSNHVDVKVTDPNDEDFAGVGDIKPDDTFFYGFGVTQDGTGYKYNQDVQVERGSTVYVCWDFQNFSSFSVHSGKSTSKPGGVTNNTVVENKNPAKRETASYEITADEDDSYVFHGVETGIAGAFVVKGPVWVHTHAKGEAASPVATIDPTGDEMIDDAAKKGELAEVSEEDLEAMKGKSDVSASGSLSLEGAKFKQKLGPWPFKYGKITGEISFGMTGSMSVAEEEAGSDGQWDKKRAVDVLAREVGMKYTLQEPALGGMSFEIEAFKFSVSGDEISCTPFAIEWGVLNGNLKYSAEVEVVAWKKGELAEVGTVKVTIAEKVPTQNLLLKVAKMGKCKADIELAVAAELTFHPDWKEIGIDIAEKLGEEALEVGEAIGALEFALVYVVVEMFEMLLNTWTAMSDFAKIEKKRDDGLEFFVMGFRKGLMSGMTTDSDVANEFLRQMYKNGSKSAAESAKKIFAAYLKRRQEEDSTVEEETAQKKFNMSLRSSKNVDKLCATARAKYAEPLMESLLNAFYEKDFSTFPQACNVTFESWFVKPVQGSLVAEVDKNGYEHPNGYIHAATITRIPGSVLTTYRTSSSKVGLASNTRRFLEGIDPADKENTDAGITTGPQRKPGSPGPL
jgi:hypothetical protein